MKKEISSMMGAKALNIDRRDRDLSHRCFYHRCMTDEYGDCPYCLSGENPPGMDEIPWIKRRNDGRPEK